VGVCVDFADLLVALSRAQGIPARVAMGIKGYEDTNPGFLTPVNGSGVHAWTEIFYPEVGWIRYDATYMSHSPHIPYGIQLNAYAVEERETYPLYESKDMEFDWNSDFPWELIGLGENKVKLTYTIKLFPYYP